MQFNLLKMFRNSLPKLTIFFIYLLRICLCGEDFKQKMLDFGIVPRIVPVVPEHKCRIFYPIFGGIREVITSERLIANMTRKEPRVKWPIRENKFYAMFMVGIAPIYDLTWERGWDESLGDQNDQQWENWIVMNIPGCKIDFGDELVPYFNLPVPKINTTDRISIFIWEQPEKYENPKYDRGIENRNRFGDRYLVKTFTDQFRLGNPWAGDFFVL